MKKVIAQPEETVLSVCLPILMRIGLDEASEKMGYSKADIVVGGFMRPVDSIDDGQRFID